MTIRPEDNRTPLDPDREVQDAAELGNPMDLDETERPVNEEFDTAIDQERIERGAEAEAEEDVRASRGSRTYVNDSYNDEYMDSNQPSKRNKWILVGVLAVIIALVVYFFVSSVFASPKGKILEGVSNLEHDSIELVDEFYPDLGISQIYDNWYNGNAALAFTLNVNDPAYNVNFGFSSGMNADQKISYADLNLGLGDMQAVGAKVQLNEDEFTFAMPNLMQDVLGIDLSTFGQSMSTSPVFGAQIDDEIKNLEFHFWEGPTTPKQIKEAYLTFVRDEVADLGKDIEVKKSDSPVTVMIGDKEQKLETYDVAIPREKTINLALRSVDFFYDLAKQKISFDHWDEVEADVAEAKADLQKNLAEMPETLNFRIALDGDNRIRHFNAQVEAEGQMQEITMEALGAGNPFEHQTTRVERVDGDQKTLVSSSSVVTTISDAKNTIDMTVQTENSEEATMQMVYTPASQVMDFSTNVPVSVNGTTAGPQTLQVKLTDIKPGESITYVLTPEVAGGASDGTSQVPLELRYTIGSVPADYAKQEPTKAISEMTQGEFQTIFMSVMQTAQSIFGPLMNSLPNNF